MKPYPSIPSQITSNIPIFAFNKLDGSNVRAEWNRKKGFWKFGRRNGLLDDSNEFLPEAEHLIKAQEEVLTEIFLKQQWTQLTAFFEFWGENSFAGLHEHEPHQATLIDVSVYKKGFMVPRDFVELFEDVGAPVLYRGYADEDFVHTVRSGDLDGMSFEGVVCKGPWDRKKGRPLMFKVKNQAWIDRVKSRYGTDAKMLARLL